MKKNKKNKYAVYFTTDLNYWKHSFVSIRSFLENNGSVDVFLFYDKLNQKILDIFRNIFKGQLKLIKFQVNDIKRINYKHRPYFFRYFIPKKLKKYSKVLYLDSDTITLCSISKIFDTKLVKTIAAVEEPKYPTQKKFYIGNPKLKRFNSGVMLINTKKYISKNYLKKIIITSRNFKDKWTDQPAANYIFKNDIKYINGKWNYLDKSDPKKINKKIILHFNNFKPWKINHNSKNVKLYRQYRRLIENYYFYDDLTFKNIVKKIINFFS
tara:strand:- start:4255 stop:5058 length:804 start_codon:yes stop_codon:yes gene_type:complete